MQKHTGSAKAKSNMCPKPFGTCDGMCGMHVHLKTAGGYDVLHSLVFYAGSNGVIKEHKRTPSQAAYGAAHNAATNAVHNPANTAAKSAALDAHKRSLAANDHGAEFVLTRADAKAKAAPIIKFVDRLAAAYPRATFSIFGFHNDELGVPSEEQRVTAAVYEGSRSLTNRGGGTPVATYLDGRSLAGELFSPLNAELVLFDLFSYIQENVAPAEQAAIAAFVNDLHPVGIRAQIRAMGWPADKTVGRRFEVAVWFLRSGWPQNVQVREDYREQYVDYIRRLPATEAAPAAAAAAAPDEDPMVAIVSLSRCWWCP